LKTNPMELEARAFDQPQKGTEARYLLGKARGAHAPGKIPRAPGPARQDDRSWSQTVGGGGGERLFFGQAHAGVRGGFAERPMKERCAGGPNK